MVTTIILRDNNIPAHKHHAI